ncbi:hypothetical protein [Turneriella parva]|uniref:Curli production assembly/transport component CsgG n=1 Tax=Turneriella parva (strain ATCC BAA-1111 / DSM 21527 / NCTC 11395 / H) TaxID=869212 RepID=I4B541_TURPD|nr:hypothetical protein [Turneriella parva]AFM12398.1 hypothetical protein Turpa_1751 [Turneriella parva DSM 21527]
MQAPIFKLLLLALASSALGAARLPRVMVLETVNRSGDPNLKYLEASISDAIRTELKNRFLFTEIPVEQRNALAEKNYIFPQDFDTETAAVALGLLGRQDIVVTGSFRGNAGNARSIIVEIRIIGVGEKKILKTISHKAAVDSSVFNTLQKIATESAIEMEKILPSKDEFARISLADSFYEGGLNQVLVSFGFAPSLFAASGGIATGSELSPKDFNNLTVRAAYRRNSVYRENLYLEARGSVDFGSNKYALKQTELSDLNLPASHLGYRISAPVGMRFAFFGSLLVQPYVGPAAGFGTITVDASSTQLVVYDASRSAVTTLKKNYAGMGFISGADITLLLKSNVQIFTDIEYQMIFADGGSFFTLGFFMGAGYRL